MKFSRAIAGILLILVAVVLKFHLTEEYLAKLGLAYISPLLPVIILSLIVVGIIIASWTS